MGVVLDSWAILRYLEGAEPAAGRIAELLDVERPMMSWIDLGEVHYVLRRAHGESAAIETIRDLRDVIEPHLPDASAVLEAARITSDHPIVAGTTSSALRRELLVPPPDLLDRLVDPAS